jgi:3-methylcrotonyl-CoA carboxylase beta subunit
MGGEQAAGVLAQVKRDQKEKLGEQWRAEEEANFKQPIIDDNEHQRHPYYASARLWDDGVIDPADTRQVLGLAISASLNKPINETTFGLFRREGSLHMVSHADRKSSSELVQFS